MLDAGHLYMLWIVAGNKAVASVQWKNGWEILTLSKSEYKM